MTYVILALFARIQAAKDEDGSHSVRKQMRRHRPKTGKIVLLLLLALFLFAACGSSPGSATQQTTVTSKPTFIPTPTPTPIPTAPSVPSVPVQFTTQDHIQLTGILYGKGGTTAIICSHEHPGSKADWYDSAPWFAAHGYMVLAYDFRGWGESQGQIDASKGDKDIFAAIAFMHSWGASKIILLGASMGADISLIAASETHVAGIITLSPEYLFGLTNTRLKAISAPKLFINSVDDAYADDTRQIYQNAPPPKELHLYPGDAHGVDIFRGAYGQDLIARILAFVKKYAPLS